jgi:peptidoglycan/xylan/chitin deacetylase (PgdA/CDA1 family)
MTIKQRVKRGLYTTAKWTGMFSASRFLMRRRLTILGYHGFQYSDEARFRPILFMDPLRFERRLDTIARGHYSVLPLEEGVRRLRDGTLPANAVVITIDDGFFSVLDKAAPVLHKYGFPATLYVTSYYVTKGTPIFRLVIQYLFWKTAHRSYQPLDRPWSPNRTVDLTDAQAAREAVWQIIRYGETHCNEDQRQDICAEVALALGLDFDTIRAGRGLTLMTPDELRKLEDFGVEVQLHTHRHIFPPNDTEQAREELRLNRKILEGLLDRPLRHFCYPSGVWEHNNMPMLAEEGIASATTCEPGMNEGNTDPLALYRILDQDDLPDIEFEAELAGFCELLRLMTGRRRRTDQVHSLAR